MLAQNPKWGGLGAVQVVRTGSGAEQGQDGNSEQAKGQEWPEQWANKLLT